MFLRELVSNASDALEKLRLTRLTAGGESEFDRPLEIMITGDEVKGTLTVTDTGIGMTREELVANLGTIARSGSKEFLGRLQGGDADAATSATSIIGQFGVGFYAAFMVADKVTAAVTHRWMVTQRTDVLNRLKFSRDRPRLAIQHRLTTGRPTAWDPISWARPRAFPSARKSFCICERTVGGSPRIRN